ncbi:MAG: ferredoxin [Candidatus Omnitrophota bacterium]
MKVRVDPDICIGCTLCTQTCPEVFRMEEEKAVAYVPEVPKGLEKACLRAVDECPVTAIFTD